MTIGNEDYFVSALKLRQDSSNNNNSNNDNGSSSNTNNNNKATTPGTPQSTKRCTTFSPRIVFFETWPSQEYDRRGDIATCNRLTPMLAQQIKEELNSFKMVSFRIYKQAVLAHSPRGIWWYGGMVVC